MIQTQKECFFDIYSLILIAKISRSLPPENSLILVFLLRYHTLNMVQNKRELLEPKIYISEQSEKTHYNRSHQHVTHHYYPDR